MASLSGKADATLVKAATDAAMANVPMDVSRIHERVSKSYAALAESTGKVWGQALKTIGEVGGKLITKAKLEKSKQTAGTKKGWTNAEFEKLPTPEVVEEPLSYDAVMLAGGFDAERAPTREEYETALAAEAEELGTTKEVDTTKENTYTDSNGNSKPIVFKTTEEALNEVRELGLAIRKKGAINPITNEEWTRKEKKAAKQKLKERKNNIRQSNVDFGAFQETMTTQLADGQINMEASGAYNLPGLLFSRAMLASGEPVANKEFPEFDGARAVQGYDDEGHMVFTYVNKYGIPFQNKDGSDMTIGKDDLGSLFIPQSPARGHMDALTDRKLIQGGYGYPFSNNEQMIDASINKNIKTKETFLDIAHYRNGTDVDGAIPATGSLASKLHGVTYKNGVTTFEPNSLTDQLVKALNSIPGEYSKENPHPYDQDQDGDFDKDDWDNEENYIKLAKQVLSGDDLELGKSLLGMHLKEEARVFYDQEVAKNAKEVVPGKGEGSLNKPKK